MSNFPQRIKHSTGLKRSPLTHALGVAMQQEREAYQGERQAKAIAEWKAQQGPTPIAGVTY